MADKIRAYILIETVNGAKYKYVRDKVLIDGDSIEGSAFYSYGDTVGDSYGGQTGDSRLIKTAYDSIVSAYEGDSIVRNFVSFPENAGDTYVLKRKNFETPQTDAEYGDSDITPYTYTKISNNAVQGIHVIEERITNWDRGNVVIP